MSLTTLLRHRRLQRLGRQGALPGPTVVDAPSQLFDEWFVFAGKAGIELAESLALATTDGAGHPSCRMVLMKEYNDNEIVFYTNYDSRKAQQISANQHVALLFHWHALQRQIRVEGTAKPIEKERNAIYFASRDRLSQLGAHASAQSRAIDDPADLENTIQTLHARYPEQVPCPDHWGGYAVEPHYFEFWQGRPGRIHERLAYAKQADSWSHEWLQP